MGKRKGTGPIGGATIIRITKSGTKWNERKRSKHKRQSAKGCNDSKRHSKSKDPKLKQQRLFDRLLAEIKKKKEPVKRYSRFSKN